MKLWLRIFLSILLVSLTALTISSSYLINKSHLMDIEREQSRCLNEFDYIRSTINNGINLNTASEVTFELLISRYGEYYQSRGIRLIVLQDNQVVFDNSSLKLQDYEELLSVSTENKMVRVIGNGKSHTLLVSGMLAEENKIVLIFARDITPVYLTRGSNIRMAILVSALLILVLGSLSYLYSRWITKPIKAFSSGASSISEGDYSIRLPEPKDEFQAVASAFNHMASAVEARTTELEERAKELQIFIDDLSHEMNTPMTSIQGYAEFLQNANASEEQKQKAAENIRLQSARIKDMFAKLMTLTITREQPPELTDIDVSGLFQEIKETFHPQLTEHHITLHQQNTTHTLQGDYVLIYMLLCNLVKNSIQALPEGGNISLQAYEEGGSPVLQVKDDGFGIPQDKLSQVTKPFYRVDKSRSRKTGGAGLGLSICKNIAHLHHAELKIDSSESKGTSIRVVFSSNHE